MPRRPPRVASLASLVLLAGTCALWAISYWRWTGVWYGTRGPAPLGVEAATFNGRCLVCVFRPPATDARRAAVLREGWDWHSEPKDETAHGRQVLFALLGAEYEADVSLLGAGHLAARLGDVRMGVTMIPLGYVALAFAALPACRGLGRLGRWRRLRRGLCGVASAGSAGTTCGRARTAARSAARRCP